MGWGGGGAECEGRTSPARIFSTALKQPPAASSADWKLWLLMKMELNSEPRRCSSLGFMSAVALICWMCCTLRARTRTQTRIFFPIDRNTKKSTFQTADRTTAT